MWYVKERMKSYEHFSFFSITSSLEGLLVLVLFLLSFFAPTVVWSSGVEATAPLVVCLLISSQGDKINVCDFESRDEQTITSLSGVCNV